MFSDQIQCRKTRQDNKLNHSCGVDVIIVLLKVQPETATIRGNNEPKPPQLSWLLWKLNGFLSRCEYRERNYRTLLGTDAMLQSSSPRIWPLSSPTPPPGQSTPVSGVTPWCLYRDGRRHDPLRRHLPHCRCCRHRRSLLPVLFS